MTLDDDSVNLRSPSPDVDGVSDFPYTSSNLQTDGQPEVGRGLPSIDELDGFFNAFFDAFFAFCRFLSRNFFGILKVTIKTICICRLGPARKDGNYDEIKKRF